MKSNRVSWLVLGGDSKPFSMQCRFFTSIFCACSQQIHNIEMMANVDQDFQLSHQCFVLTCCGSFCKCKIKSMWIGKELVLVSFTTFCHFPLPLLGVLRVLMFFFYSSLPSILILAIKPIKRVRQSTSSQ